MPVVVDDRRDVRPNGLVEDRDRAGRRNEHAADGRELLILSVADEQAPLVAGQEGHDAGVGGRCDRDARFRIVGREIVVDHDIGGWEPVAPADVDAGD
jgi:hypothetical protein